MQVAGLAISGVKFLVHPDAWVVHRPHDKTAVQRLYVVALNNRAKMQKAGREVELPTNFTDASALSSSQVRVAISLCSCLYVCVCVRVCVCLKSCWSSIRNSGC